MNLCPDHDTPAHPTLGCHWCVLEWQATDQGAGAARVREAMPPRARARPLTAPAPLPARDPDQLERTRARLDQLPLELEDGAP